MKSFPQNESGKLAEGIGTLAGHDGGGIGIGSYCYGGGDESGGQ